MREETEETGRRRHHPACLLGEPWFSLPCPVLSCLVLSCLALPCRDWRWLLPCSQSVPKALEEVRVLELSKDLNRKSHSAGENTWPGTLSLQPPSPLWNEAFSMASTPARNSSQGMALGRLRGLVSRSCFGHAYMEQPGDAVCAVLCVVAGAPLLQGGKAYPQCPRLTQHCTSERFHRCGQCTSMTLRALVIWRECPRRLRHPPAAQTQSNPIATVLPWPGRLLLGIHLHRPSTVYESERCKRAMSPDYDDDLCRTAREYS